MSELIDSIMLPEVSVVKSDSEKALVCLSPLARGYGNTIGNMLRRILLSSIPGASVVAIKVEGVTHEFTSSEGVREDVADIILNLKGVIFQLDENIKDSVEVKLKSGVSGTITAEDFDLPTGVSIKNPEHVIAILQDNAELPLTVLVSKGIGYFISEDDNQAELSIGWLKLDATFSPIKSVKISVENTRVANKTNLDKLYIDIVTDNSITGLDAYNLAVKIMSKQVVSLSSVKLELPAANDEVTEVVEEEEVEIIDPKLLQKYDMKIDALDIPVRSLNSLKSEGITYVGELIQLSEANLMKIPNLGKKSVLEITSTLQLQDLNLDTVVETWAPKEVE